MPNSLKSSPAVLEAPQFFPSDTDTDKVRRSRIELRLKRAFDISVVIALVLTALPLALAIICCLYGLQGRPIFIKHVRVGRGGKRFFCLKFRTMVTDGDAVLHRHLEQDAAAREEWTVNRKLRNDPRVTPLGRVLRKSSVDEIPQFINVLRGEMSLVGPRPIVDAEIQYYGSQIHKYYCVRPGLTGLWQISGRNNLSFNDRVNLDSHYIGNWSFVQDLVILIKTVPAILISRGSY